MALRPPAQDFVQILLINQSMHLTIFFYFSLLLICKLKELGLILLVIQGHET